MGRVAIALKTVLSETKFFVAAIVLSIAIGLLFAVSMNILYLDPLFINYFNFFEDGIINAVFNIIIIFVMPIFASLTITTAAYQFSVIKKSIAKEGGVATLSAIPATFVTTCSNCVPVALYSLGVTYGIFEAVFAPFVLHFKILTVIAITVSFYIAANNLGRVCKIRR